PPYALIPPQPPLSTLFPYTTLFRSGIPQLKPYPASKARQSFAWLPAIGRTGHQRPSCSANGDPVTAMLKVIAPGHRAVPITRRRSEEHTSELQSRENLVCRLLLEKK